MSIYDIISGLTDFWDMLQKTDRPVVLYGMGNGADKIILEAEKRNVAVSGIFASDDFVRYQSFHGFTVQKYDELKAQLPNMLVLICFGTQRPEVLCNINKIAAQSETYAPDVAVIGDGLFTKEYALCHINEIEQLYNRLSDELSKKTLLNILCYKISGDIRYLADCESDDMPLDFQSSEIFVDLGAYTGDTVAEFIKKTGGKYDKIIAVEPDIKNYNKLVKNTVEYDNIIAHNLCISDKSEQLVFAMNSGRNSGVSESGKTIAANSVDNILNGMVATYIKMDVEGQENAAISGACTTILQHKPKMKIAAYHKAHDMLDIPSAVLKIRDDYRIFLRHKPYVPAWDTDYYFV